MLSNQVVAANPIKPSGAGLASLPSIFVPPRRWLRCNHFYFFVSVRVPMSQSCGLLTRFRMESPESFFFPSDRSGFRAEKYGNERVLLCDERAEPSAGDDRIYRSSLVQAPLGRSCFRNNQYPDQENIFGKKN
jgi:hypothetical protein